jgi:hypothetical protein
MNRDYAVRRIREALKASGGNPARAQQKVAELLVEDDRLLRELVAPHMRGIIAHAVYHVLNTKEEAAPTPPEAAPLKPDAKSDPFGLEILKAIALGNPAQFGLENSAPIKKQAASQRHVDAIRQMVEKAKDSKKK